MSAVTIFVLLGLAIWWYKPLRVLVIQRTNRTVKVLLVLFPALFIGRAVYSFLNGEPDTQWFIVAGTVAGLLAVWGALVWLGNWLEKRRPTKVQGPDFAALARLPGVPRMPQAAQVLADPQVQRAAAAAAQAAAPHVQRAARALAQVDTGSLATAAGRSTGRLYARLRRSFRDGAGGVPKGSTPPPAAAPATPVAPPASPPATARMAPAPQARA
jgi:hypothetical protein